MPPGKSECWMIVALAGGVGAARFLEGLVAVAGDGTVALPLLSSRLNVAGLNHAKLQN